ncbi:uncharacterized protein [Ambystoma mexicanum]|uniref:uncharacterized protein n=1 Tax=Ambystoma mexicanum TaxID=8296 RepID=UPI0037E7EC20
MDGMKNFCMAYLVDIAVFSSTRKEHVDHLGYVLQALEQAHLTIKASNCQMGQSKVVYLGHEVGGGETRSLPSKVQAVQEWANPTTQFQVRAFLGITGYYRNVIENYRSIASPLHVISSPKSPKRSGGMRSALRLLKDLRKPFVKLQS